jgi:hypothetical protein
MRNIWTTAYLNCGFPCEQGSIARSFSIAGGPPDLHAWLFEKDRQDIAR